MNTYYSCDKGLEEALEVLLTNYHTLMVHIVLTEAGCVPEIKYRRTSEFSVEREEHYHVTMDIIQTINDKGLKHLGEKGLQSRADRVTACIADTVGKGVEIDLTKTQRCSDCGETKFLSEFYRNKTKKLGVNNICKECQKSRNWSRSEAKQATE